METRTVLTVTSTAEKADVCHYIQFTGVQYRTATIYFDPAIFRFLKIDENEVSPFIKKIAAAIALAKENGTATEFYVTQICLDSPSTYQIAYISPPMYTSLRKVNLNELEEIHEPVQEISLLKLPDTFQRARSPECFSLSDERCKTWANTHAKMLEKKAEIAEKEAQAKVQEFVNRKFNITPTDPIAPKVSKWNAQQYDAETTIKIFPQLASTIAALQEREVALSSTLKTLEATEAELSEYYDAVCLQTKSGEKETGKEEPDELKKYIEQQYASRLAELRIDIATVKSKKNEITRFLSCPNFVLGESKFVDFSNQQKQLIYIKKLLAFALQDAAKNYFILIQSKNDRKRKIETLNNAFKEIAYIKGFELIYENDLAEKFASFSLEEIKLFIKDLLKRCDTGYSSDKKEAVLTALGKFFHLSGLVVVSNDLFFNAETLKKEANLKLAYSQAEKEIEEESKQIIKETAPTEGQTLCEVIQNNLQADEDMQKRIEQQRRFINYKNRLKELRDELVRKEKELASLAFQDLACYADGNLENNKEPAATSEKEAASSSTQQSETVLSAQDTAQREWVLGKMKEEIEFISARIREYNNSLLKIQEKKQTILEEERLQCIVNLNKHISLVLEEQAEEPEWAHIETSRLKDSLALYKLKLQSLEEEAKQSQHYSILDVEEAEIRVAKIEEELKEERLLFQSSPALKTKAPATSSPVVLKGRKDKEKQDEEEKSGPGPISVINVPASPSLSPQKKSIKGKIIGALTGGGIGALVGGGLGALIGFFLAPVTFGASVPVGAAIGATIGGTFGGLAGGGIIGLGLGHLFDTWWEGKENKKKQPIENGPGNTDFPPAEQKASSFRIKCSSTHRRLNGAFEPGPNDPDKPVSNRNTSSIDENDEDWDSIIGAGLDAINDLQGSDDEQEEKSTLSRSIAANRAGP